MLIGGVFIVMGAIWIFGERFGLGHLPGDISIRKDNMQINFPIVTSIIVSVILTGIMWLFNHFRR